MSLRFQMMRNAVTTLMCSRGTPMILAGDEFGNTQFGNNNGYCQDNEISWLDWKLLNKNKEYFDFCKSVIAFRKKHRCISRKLDNAHCGFPDISVNGGDPEYTQITPQTRTMNVLYAGFDPKKQEDDVVYLMLNPYWESISLRLPALPEGLAWGLCIDTAASDKAWIHEEPQLCKAAYCKLEGRSAKVLTVIRKEV